MTADHSASSHSTYLTDHQESPHMNLDTIAQLETQARQAECSPVLECANGSAHRPA